MFVIPKDREVPFAGITPAPVGAQRMMITGNWRSHRPILNAELCNLCQNCIIFCPDACWQLNPAGDGLELNLEFCKGCMICVEECTAGALTKADELDFDDGVVRLEKLF